MKEDTQYVILKIKGEIAFNYFFDDLDCKMQSITDGVVSEEWEIDERLRELQD